MNFRLPALIIALLVATGGAFLLLNGSNKLQRTPPGTLRIGSVNLNAQNDRPALASRALARADADIMLLQEWTGHNASVSILREPGLDVVLSDPRSGTHGAAILARPALKVDSEIAPPPWQGACAIPLATALLRTSTSQIGILGVHAPPPISVCRTSRTPYLMAVAELVDNGKLREHVGAIPAGTTVILLGDLNAFPWEAPLDKLSGRGLLDGFDAGSWMLGLTWSPSEWLPPVARLDYVWVPEDWGVVASSTLAVPGSDHKGVFVDVTTP